jgi:hypothetical protein
MRQFAQRLAQSTAIIALRLEADRGLVRRNVPVRLPLADINKA